MYVFTPNSIILSSQINYNFDELFNGRNTSPYKFSAFLTAPQSSIASGNSQDIAFNATYFDTNNNFDIGFGIYTVPVDGYYEFSAQYLAYYGGTASPTRADLQIRVKHGDADYVIYATSQNNFATAVTRITPSAKLIRYCNAGDLVKVVAQIHYSSGAPYVMGEGFGQYTKFDGRLIGV